ncbi:MAG TPA: hypothetical protein VFC85_00910 [Verrucomicrobiae bacterium]|nr:hypothetical protein [Verrucomicrobiae bacterium]
MKTKIIFALATIALGTTLTGCMSADDQTNWQSQQQLRDAQSAQNQAQIKADRVQRATDQENVR